MPRELNAPFLQSRMVKRYQLKGRSSAAPELDDTIIPVVVVDDISTLDTFDAQEDVRTCFGSAYGSDAVNEWRIQIGNPSDSTVLVYLDRAILSSRVNLDVDGVRVAINLAMAEPAYVYKCFCDGRLEAALSQPAAQIRQANGPPSGGQMKIHLANNAPGPDYQIRMLLLPGQAFEFKFGAVANQCQATFFWREQSLKL